MKENKNNPTTQLDKEPGKPGYKPGNTGIPQHEVVDEDAKAELEHEKNQPKQDTDDETRKIVNEQEQEQVVNNDDANTQTKPAKMSEKPA
jgi:hypothetical protein